MFEHFPYTNMHELNLDWIIEQVKKAYSPDNPPENIVLTVNGQTGNVVLYEAAIVKLPTVDDADWNIYRLTAGNHARGIEFSADGTAKIINDTIRDQIYTTGHPPAYPVQSVNGQTGNVVLYQEQNIQLPTIDGAEWNVYRFADGQAVGIRFEKDRAIYRIDGSDRVKVYDEENQPPYPVTSVNGQTGAVNLTFPVTSVNGQTGNVTLQIPFVDTTEEILEVTPDSPSNYWGLQRETTGGTAGIYMEAVNNTVNAYITFQPEDESQVEPQTYKLLTTADIPSSSGVVSINGKTGVVTLYGTDIYRDSESNRTVNQELADIITKNSSQDTYIQQNAAAIQSEQARAMAIESNIEKAFATIVNGDTAALAIPAGHFAYIKNNTHGLTEGLYIARAAFPATGGTADSTAFAPDPDGGLNTLKEEVDSLNSNLSDYHSNISGFDSEEFDSVRVDVSSATVIVTVEIKSGLATGWHNGVQTAIPSQYMPYSGVNGVMRIGGSADGGKIAYAFLNGDGTITFYLGSTFNNKIIFSFVYGKKNI